MKIGIIGGSGLYEIDGLEFLEEIKLDNRFGSPSDNYKIFDYKDCKFYFLNRHGKNHKILPHKVNYRANIYGFYELGVKHIFSFTAVGGINKLLKPGDMVVPDNAIDMTYGRNSTFYDELEEKYHIDFTNPFCSYLRTVLIESCMAQDLSFFDVGTYICTNGPRLETAAEIKFYKQVDADIVGMTLFPEAPLARELEICYANMSIVTNYAAGISKTKLTVDEVIDTMKKSNENIKKVIQIIPDFINTVKNDCECKNALKGTRIDK